MKKIFSPINMISMQNKYYKQDLSDLQARYNSLREEHRKLVKDSVEVERNFEELKDSIQSMCKGCNEMGTSVCDNCPLQDSAIKFKLWED